jgi:hypothetical protein
VIHAFTTRPLFNAKGNTAMFIDEMAIIAIVPGIVEIVKRVGLPVRFAGVAAIVSATILVVLTDISGGGGGLADPARWLLLGIVCGLAASGLYSQVRHVVEDRTGQLHGG